MSVTRTIGLDFGTHQTKMCIQEITEDGITSYDFASFMDARGKECFTMPTMAWLNEDDTLSYGYKKGSDYIEYFQYFKQAVFTKNIKWVHSISPTYVAIWYIANLFFDLEDKYGEEFGIQMGIPTDSEFMEERKKDAVCILLSAFNLVENVFEHDKQAFLKTKFSKLVELTKMMPYDEDQKLFYSIIIIPESLACLMPITANRRLESGMNLMVDIGGGTTDISFFTISYTNGMPIIYRFTSIPYGLNYLTKADELDKELDIKNHKISPDRLDTFHQLVKNCCKELERILVNEFAKTGFDQTKLLDALRTRPILYTGGGSSFSFLREGYSGFSDVKHVSIKEWHTEEINDLEKVKSLCPVLSTCYGLSSAMMDDMELPISDIENLFAHMKNTKSQVTEKIGRSNQSHVSDALEMGGVDFSRGSAFNPKKVIESGIVPPGAPYELKYGYQLAQKYANVNGLIPLDSPDKVALLLKRLGKLAKTSSALRLYLSHAVPQKYLNIALNQIKKAPTPTEVMAHNDADLLLNANEEQQALILKIRQAYNGPLPFKSVQNISDFFNSAGNKGQKYSAKMLSRNLGLLCGNDSVYRYFEKLLVPPPPPKKEPQPSAKKKKKKKKLSAKELYFKNRKK